MLSRGKSADAAARAKRYRQRRRNGEQVYRVTVNERVIEALLRRGLNEADSRNRRKVADELGEVLREWSDRWLK
jgi:hypothetical protein